MDRRNLYNHPNNVIGREMGRRKEAKRIVEIHDKVKKLFDISYHIKFHRFVGDGSHGGTGIFSANDPKRQGVTDPEKYIVKFSLGVLPNGDDSDAHLRNEARWLDHLSGSEHFITKKRIDHLAIGKWTWGEGAGEGAGKGSSEVAGKEASEGAVAGAGAGTGDGTAAATMADRHGGAPADDGGLAAYVGQLDLKEQQNSSGADGHGDAAEVNTLVPFLVLEYLPMGDLNQLRERLVAKGKPVPSRLLWGFALCLVRMCIGLAYYTHTNPGQREEIPPNTSPSTLAHNSIKTPNILLDMLKPGDGEHALTPVLKMIDFGRTERRDLVWDGHPDGAGVATNLYHIGSVIATLAATEVGLGDNRTWIPREEIFRWYHRSTNELQAATNAHANFCVNTRIDRRLRGFVAGLMEVRAHRRPSLQLALETCKLYAEMTAEDMFPHGVPDDETDEAIKQYVADVVFNAPPPAPPPLSAPAPAPAPPPVSVPVPAPAQETETETETGTDTNMNTVLV